MNFTQFVLDMLWNEIRAKGNKRTCFAEKPKQKKKKKKKKKASLYLGHIFAKDRGYCLYSARPKKIMGLIFFIYFFCKQVGNYQVSCLVVFVCYIQLVLYLILFYLLNFFCQVLHSEKVKKYFKIPLFEYASTEIFLDKNIEFPRGNYQPIVPRQKHSIV